MAKKIIDPEAGWDCPAGPDGLEGEPGLPDAPPAPKPKRGRPRCAEEPCGNISVWLPDSAQDRIITLASRRKQSVSEYLRDVLTALFLRKS